MSDYLLRLYHMMPGPFRSAVATVHGYRLRRWRYGPELERLVEEALERETWTQARWKAWQEERLAYILHRAATHVPYYREQWMARRRRGDRSSWENLENWPILDKEPLRSDPHAFLADDCDPRSMYQEYTSGTTGKPLRLWWSRDTVRNWYALFEARWRRWYGVSLADRWAIIGGRLVAPVSQRRPPFWVWNAAMNQLYMSAYHISPSLAPHYLDALARYRVRYLWGYTSSLHALALEALRGGRSDLKMRVVITNAEPVSERQKQVIERAFQCPVRETYGMGEAVAAASECGVGRLHLWPEAGLVEVLDHGEPAAPGAPGDMICTGLFNADMPLIRYRVGDRGALQEPAACGCGRGLPLLAYVEGRSDDVLYTADGRRVFWLEPVFAEMPVYEAQIIQEALDHVRVRYVPAPGFTAEDARTIVRRLQDRMGAVAVTMEEVAEIPRGPNGKFRAVVCELPPEQRVGTREEETSTASPG